MALHILSIVGARPQFVKAAMLVEAIRARNGGAQCRTCRLRHTLLHTGQHYDQNMSDVFFRQMPLPKPKYNLGVGSGSHGVQTGRLLSGIERVLLSERPDVVVVFGDTNSTLAGAMAAAKLGIKVAHVEAGLRSFNRAMPEEINRVVTDHLSDILFCPTETAVRQLAAEGIRKAVFLSGDVMLDAVLSFLPVAGKRSRVLHKLSLDPKQFVLLTVHRAENTDSQSSLASVLEMLVKITHPVVFPVHPRTRSCIAKAASLKALATTAQKNSYVRMIDPVPYLDMLTLESRARVVMTDSGGVQKEAYFLGVPCLTMRSETEWTETLVGGWNQLVDPQAPGTMNVLNELWNGNGHLPTAPRNLDLFGGGKASGLVVQQLLHSILQEN